MDPTAVCMLAERPLMADGNLVPIMRAMEGTPMHPVVLDKPTKQVRRGASGALTTLRAMAGCGYILLEEPSALMQHITPRSGQTVIQTWHASGPFKKVGFSRRDAGEDPGPIRHRHYDYAIVGSEESRAPYAEAFGMPLERVLPIGLPRTDRLVDPTYAAERRQAILSARPELAGKRIVLLAPTFRGADSYAAHHEWERYDLDGLASALGERYAILVKPHPYTAQHPRRGPEQRRFLAGVAARHPGIVYDFTDYSDVNDLLFVTDVLVTDYSSVVFEWSFLGRPVVFFAYDYDAYLRQRGFYFPFDSYTYGPVVRSASALPEAVATARVDVPALVAFRERFLSACDGHAAERFVARLLTKEPRGADTPA